MVLGGGYVAVEFASILQGLGVETTLIYRGPLILRGFDADMRGFVMEEKLRKFGIDLRLETGAGHREADRWVATTNAPRPKQRGGGRAGPKRANDALR